MCGTSLLNKCISMAIIEKSLFVLMGLKKLESYYYCVKCMFKFTPETLGL